MSTVITPYPFDPTGKQSTNTVKDEQQIISPPNYTDFYFLIPKYAPFFRTGFKAILRPSGRELIEGVDFVFSYKFVEASLSTETPIYGAISFYDKTIAGVVDLQYQTIGGDWTLDAAKIAEILADRQHNPRITTWSQVAELPYAFPPINHEHNVVDLIGMSAVVKAVEKVAAAVKDPDGGGTGGGDGSGGGSNTPVTKESLGLDKLANYPLATRQDAEAGTSDELYMTPLRAKQLVDVFAVAPLNAHIANKDNPHEVNKEQVQLGKVDNYATAGVLDGENGGANNLFMTPIVTRRMIEVFAIAALDSHINDHDNPHKLTPDKIGAITQLQLTQAVTNLNTTLQKQIDGKIDTSSRGDIINQAIQAAADNSISQFAYSIAGYNFGATLYQQLAEVTLGDVVNFNVRAPTLSLLVTNADKITNTSPTAYLVRLKFEQGIALEVLALDGTTSTVQFGYTATPNEGEDPNDTSTFTPGKVALWVKNPADGNELVVTEISKGAGTLTYSSKTLEVEPKSITYATSAFVWNNQTFKPDSKLDVNAQAADAAKLEGKTLATILGDLSDSGVVYNAKQLEGNSLAKVLAAAAKQKAADSFLLEGKTTAEIIAEALAGKAADAALFNGQNAGFYATQADLQQLRADLEDLINTMVESLENSNSDPASNSGESA